ncbi:MAG: hypothetical protein KDB14_25555 [Planctomycetales bacterium]|nr:hypothetical protein [Planctomycetales bacterium]
MSKRTTSQRQRTHHSNLRRRRLWAEQLETRRLLAADVADDLATLSDEFDNAATLGDWSRINVTEGWNADQLEAWDIDGTQPGRMTMIPHTAVWYQDWRGPMVFKELTGDFVVTSEVHIGDRDDVGDSDPDDVPDDAQFSLGGVMIRTPRAITSPADWSPGSGADDGTNNGENYVFLSMGHADDGAQFSLEVKTTRNSNSQLELTPLGSDTATIQLARIGNTVLALYRLPGQDWVVHRRYDRPDMPETLQVGLVTYTDWGKAGDFDPFFQNSHVLEPGITPDPTPAEPFNPDLVAGFEYMRFARPDVPPELAGVDLLNVATNEQLLSFLGDHAAAPPVEPPAGPLAEVSIAATVGEIAESGGADFVVTRNGDLSQPLQVHYTVGGTASAADYAALSGEVSFAAGASQATVTLSAVDDALLEGSESVQLQLVDEVMYDLGVDSSAVMWLIDDDFPFIGDQTMSPVQGTLELPLPELLPSGESLSYDVHVVGGELYELDQSLGLEFAGSYYTNWGGQQEKWLTSPTGWHYLLPDGGLYAWAGDFVGSALLASLDVAVYDDPSVLHDATASATAEYVGGVLSITPAAGFLGTFQVEVTMSNGATQSMETFSVDVANAAPQLDPLNDVAMNAGDGPLDVMLQASDPDGDLLTFSAVLVQPAYDLDQQHQFETPADYFQNWGGQQERWIQDAGGVWHYLLPGGGLYRWEGSFGDSALLGELGADVYDDPTLLTEAQPLPVQLEVVGNVLTVSPEASVSGAFEVRVEVTDGAAADSQTFQVAIANLPPSLDPIADQVMAADQVLLALTLTMADPEGQPLLVTAEVVDAVYALDQSLGLWSDGDYHTNWGGQQEKWIRDSDNQWLFLLPNGELRRWNGDFATSELVAQLDSSIYDNPALLTDASPIPVQVSWVDGELRIERPAGYLGQILVRVTVSDGVHEAMQEFLVDLL